jgi:hypothetical protein
MVLLGTATILSGWLLAFLVLFTLVHKVFRLDGASITRFFGAAFGPSRP